jgi:hypothetical protein
MTILDCTPEREVSQERGRWVAEAVKPPRLNFAGICLHCGERSCEASECVTWHERSRWMVCPDCDGEGWTEPARPCGCLFGVVEAWPALADIDWTAAL